MSSPRGARSAVGEAMSWLAAAILLVTAISHFEEIRAVTSEVTGLPLPAFAPRAFGDASLPVAEANSSPMPSAGKPAAIGGRVELRAGANGHFYTHIRINGKSLPVLVDTGASFVALPYQAAKAIGIAVSDRDFTDRVQTANGTARIAPIVVPAIEIGGIVVENVRAAVGEPGAMHMTLLGMSFLSRLQRAEIRRGRLILEN